jgi:hypothetical protein
LFTISNEGNRHEKFAQSEITAGVGGSTTLTPTFGYGSAYLLPVDMHKFLGLFLACIKYHDEANNSYKQRYLFRLGNKVNNTVTTLDELPSTHQACPKGRDMSHSLQIALWASGAAAVALASVGLGYVVSQNLGSRNIALATGALAGAVIFLGGQLLFGVPTGAGALAAAILLLGIQLLFELHAEERTDFITAEYTIDRAKPEIRQWKYDQGQRLIRDLDGSGAFAAAHPGQFDGDREKLTQDMVIFSLLSYFGVEQQDWQMKRTQFVGQSMGTLTLTAPGSKPDECTEVTRAQLRMLLLDAGNAFADGNMFFGYQALRLPPNSTIEVKAGSVVLRNPFCNISFVLESSGSVAFYKPGTGALKQPTLPNGESKLETRLTNIRVTVRSSAMKAQHRDMPKYDDWSKSVVSGAQSWFMGDRLVSPLIKAVQELKDDIDKLRAQMTTLVATLKEPKH